MLSTISNQHSLSETSDSTPEITANPEVPDSEPGSSGLENNAEIYQSDDESASNGSAQSHYGHHQCFVATAEDNLDLDIDSRSNCDNDDDDEELMLEQEEQRNNPWADEKGYEARSRNKETKEGSQQKG